MRPAQTEILRERWARLLTDLGCPDDAAAPTFAAVCQQYASAGRHYHTLAHVRAVLETLDTLSSAPAPALRAAAWFHDVVYDSRAADNEEQSAALASRVLGPLGVPAGVLAEIERLILVTKTHSPGPADRQAQILVDADLAILGTGEAEYQDYAEAIRREYAWVAEEAYRAGRARVLRTFLARPRIYLTEELFCHREEAARRNLRREIEALGGDARGREDLTSRPS